MARTKRKINPLCHPDGAQETTRTGQRIYRAAGYARLSLEDSGRPGADTIESQMEMVRNYIETQPDMEFTAMHCDNGHTGTSFSRPGFDSLMQDVKDGKADCIVVKDLSRFGRNYREAGNYIERIFPFMGVRFVALTDNFDTLHAERTDDGYIVPLKNMLNEMYSRDMSKKVGTALAEKRKRGELTGAVWAVYGYRKCADDPHKIEPDEETAPVVQEMFRMRADGMSYYKIVQELNRRGIPAPSRYHYLKGDTKCARYADVVWQPQVARRILCNEVYLGHMVQGRWRRSFYEEKQRHTVPEQEWVVVRNTHEPLVDENTFRIVQDMAAKQKAGYLQGLGKHDELGKKPNILRKLIFCAECGYPLYPRVYSHGNRLNWGCSGTKRYGKEFCVGINVPDSVIRGWDFGDSIYICTSDSGRGVRDFSYLKEQSWKRRHKKKRFQSEVPELTEEDYPYMKKLHCALCGNRMVRHMTTPAQNVYWICNGNKRKGKDFCVGVRVPDEVVRSWENIDSDIYIEGKDDKNGKKHYCYSSERPTRE